MDMLSQLIHLSYQFGPFAFALIFLFLLVRWGQKKYAEVCNRATPPPTRGEKATYCGVFIGMAVIGAALVGVSVFWWWNHQPFYLYEGQISQIVETDSVEGKNFFSRNEYYQQDKDRLAPQFRDVHFFIFQQEPFKDGQEFKLRFFRDRRLSTPLMLKIRAGVRLVYALDYDKQKDEWRLRTDGNAAVARYELLSNAHAQVENTRSPVLPRAPAAPSIRILDMPAPPVLTKPSAIGPEYEALAKELQNSATQVSRKVELLDKLQSASTRELSELFATHSLMEPFVITLMDLTRHTDKEIAAKAQRAISKAPLPIAYFSSLLASKNPAKREEAREHLLRLEPRYAEGLLSELSKRGIDTRALKNLVTPNAKWRLLVPTGTVSGDKYFIKAEWDENTPATVSCLSSTFNAFASTGKTPQQNVEYMKAANVRVVAGGEKTQALRFATYVEKCGGKATFVGYYPTASK